MAVQTIKATIQMRQGDEKDFDPDKMTVGEWAVSKDVKYVRMCFAPGLCLRMSTYEAFEEDMFEIQTILATCQDIREAVEAFEQLAEQHASEAETWSIASKSWAVGGTGTREGEDTNNSKYWSQQSKTEADRAKSEADRAASIADFDPDNYFSFSGGTEISSGEDLNDVTDVGNYFCRIDQAVKTLLNCPVAKVFNMKVFYGTGNFILTQMIRCYDGEILFRYQKNNGEWQSWEHTYEPMKGATASVAGKEGLVPAPSVGKQDAYLRGDGTWVAPSTNLSGTVPGIPLDQTMGKQLKDELDGISTTLDGVASTQNFEEISRDKLKDNLLLVDLGTELADANKTRLFNNPSVNSPVDNDYFMGIWKCYWFSPNHVMVELKEMYPVAGRTWTNFFNNTRWYGWNSVTPIQ